MTLSEFLNMGGYAFYVWTSYALGAGILFYNWFGPWRRERRLRARLRRRLRNEQRNA